ncbi:MAG: GntR family transcriptional regulator [Alphaproteobacteria bacterium]|nr:GntR family transcriptional regulator [Alphaproteobacteria bacterium]
MKRSQPRAKPTDKPRARAQGGVPTFVEAIKEDILFGRLRPRERLVEDDLILRLKATRHGVRSALIELERLGLIIRIANKGAVVRDFSREEIEQICAVREMLHAQAARMVPLPAGPALLAELEAAQAAHARAVADADPAAIQRRDDAFHSALFAACGNRFLAATIAEYRAMSLGFRCQLMANPTLAAGARDEHAAMIDALRRGDRARLVRLCVNHTRASRTVYMALQGWAAVPLAWPDPATAKEPALDAAEA